MSKRKQTPILPGLPSSQDQRERHARLAGAFSFSTDTQPEVRLSVGRAEAFVARCKDLAAKRQRLRREARARVAEAIEEAVVRRRYLAEQREIDRAIERFWRRFLTKVRKPAVRQTKGGKPRKSPVPRGYAQLPAYSGPVLDRLGRRGVYMNVRYYGARRARVGVARRLVVYITRENGVELDAEEKAIILSNVGMNPAEQAMAFDLVESLNRAAQGNAKVVFSMIVGLPHDVSAKDRREILDRFCREAFGLHDLPYVAVAHEPSKEGDQRNTHGHIVFALRPLRRVGDHEWDAGRELLTEFDKPERFAFYRELFAQVMTEVAQEKWKRRVYTHLSNAERGLKAKPLIPLGPAKAAIVRRGGHVPENERNRAEIAQSERLLAEDRAAHRHERQSRRIEELRTLIAEMVDRSPVVAATANEPFASAVAAPAAAAVEALFRGAEGPAAVSEPPMLVKPPASATSAHEPPVKRMRATELASSQPSEDRPITAAIAAPGAGDAPHLEPAHTRAQASIAPATQILCVASPAASSPRRDRRIVARGATIVSRGTQPVRNAGARATPLERTLVHPGAPETPSVRRIEAARSHADAGFVLAVTHDPAVAMEPRDDAVRKPPRAPQLESPDPVPGPRLDGLAQLQRMAEERAARRRQAKERKRAGPGLPPWIIGGDGIGGR